VQQNSQHNGRKDEKYEAAHLQSEGEVQDLSVGDTVGTLGDGDLRGGSRGGEGGRSGEETGDDGEGGGELHLAKVKGGGSRGG
jgi:hypothetical protein